MPLKSEEKVVDAVIDEEEKTYFFPRMVAYIIDIICVALVSGCIMLLIPENDNYKKYMKEYEAIQADFLDQKMDIDEYLNKSVDVVYDIDYNNTPAMIIEVVVVILYFIVFQYYNKGQTLGKKIMKIKVVSTKDELTLNQLAIRSLIINSVLANLLIIGCLLFIGRSNYYYASLGLQGFEGAIVIATLLMILIRKDGKGIHDLLTSTRVVNAK